MTAYIIVALQSFGTDWDIHPTIFLNKEEAIEECAKLNNKISGYEYFVKERELV